MAALAPRWGASAAAAALLLLALGSPIRCTSLPNSAAGSRPLSAALLLGGNTIALVSADEGHVEMDGFLERLSAKIDGRFDEPEPEEKPRSRKAKSKPPPAGPDPAPQPSGGGAPSKEAFDKTFPGRQPVRMQKIDPEAVAHIERDRKRLGSKDWQLTGAPTAAASAPSPNRAARAAQTGRPRKAST